MSFESEILLGDPVTFRRHPGAHSERGRCVGRAKARRGWEYDVEPEDGSPVVFGASGVQLDRERAQ